MVILVVVLRVGSARACFGFNYGRIDPVNEFS